MFLVTTADQRFWKTDEKVLFLGEWCRLYSQKSVWSKLDHQVLPYHWDDLEKRYQDTLYLHSVYESFLENLSSRLNELHGLNYSIRYWRVLVGPWLGQFIPIFYDAFLSIQTAVDSGLVSKAWLSNTKSGQYLPDSTGTYSSWVKSNEGYRHYLYSWVLNEFSEVNFEIQEILLASPPLETSRPVSVSNSIQREIKNLFGLFLKFCPESWSDLVVVNGFLPFWDTIKLRISLRKFPLHLYGEIPAQNLPMARGLREKLTPLPSENEFESLLGRIIAEQLPTVFVEGYKDMKKRSLATFPKHPRAILPGVQVYSDDGFKFWSAHQVESGVKLIGIQHGGGYGAGRAHWFEEHEKNIFDRFYTWGWSSDNDPDVKPMPSPMLSCLKKKMKPDPVGGILWVGISTTPRYFYVLASNLLSSQVLDYIKDQERFAQTVSSEVHDLLLLRLHPVEFGWDEEKRWADLDPSLKIYRGTKPIIHQLNKCRLCVQTYNGTSLLETFSANFPTISFWNHDHWQLRESTWPYFDELREVGIFHDTPESAAAMVNDIYEDINAWWMSKKVQEVRVRFCNEFARTNKTWLKDWKEELSKYI